MPGRPEAPDAGSPPPPRRAARRGGRAAIRARGGGASASPNGPAKARPSIPGAWPPSGPMSRRRKSTGAGPPSRRHSSPAAPRRTACRRRHERDQSRDAEPNEPYAASGTPLQPRRRARLRPPPRTAASRRAGRPTTGSRTRTTTRTSPKAATTNDPGKASRVKLARPSAVAEAAAVVIATTKAPRPRTVQPAADDGGPDDRLARAR